MATPACWRCLNWQRLLLAFGRGVAALPPASTWALCCLAVWMPLQGLLAGLSPHGGQRHHHRPTVNLADAAPPSPSAARPRLSPGASPTFIHSYRSAAHHHDHSHAAPHRHALTEPGLLLADGDGVDAGPGAGGLGWQWLALTSALAVLPLATGLRHAVPSVPPWSSRSRQVRRLERPPDPSATRPG